MDKMNKRWGSHVIIQQSHLRLKNRDPQIRSFGQAQRPQWRSQGSRTSSDWPRVDSVGTNSAAAYVARITPWLGWFWICETWKLGSIGAWFIIDIIGFTAWQMQFSQEFSRFQRDEYASVSPSHKTRSVLGPTIAATDAIPMASLGRGSPSPWISCGGAKRVAQCWECRRDVGHWGEWVPKLSALSHPSEELLPSGEHTKLAIENGPVEIVDFPINSMVIFHCYVSSPEGINIY